ncbi:unnamed protein product [Prorocentrum cordatum]|uniref:Pentatricopeptide repeat-containing protein, chloroplastic n=1 Tax=Prorocentrum cordatum TaxID=2364126 RepID=A0ABN9TRT5_9DINO|nr:unnamed protein product [Polarella glacialis]
MREAVLEPNTISYCVAVSACEKSAQWQRALRLLSEMREVRVELSTVSFNAGISACEKGKQWQRALGLFGEMQEANIKLDSISYSAGISACEKGAQWQSALGLLSKMCEAIVEADVISSTTQGRVRSVVLVTCTCPPTRLHSELAWALLQMATATARRYTTSRPHFQHTSAKHLPMARTTASPCATSRQAGEEQDAEHDVDCDDDDDETDHDDDNDDDDDDSGDSDGADGGTTRVRDARPGRQGQGRRLRPRARRHPESLSASSPPRPRRQPGQP